MGIKHEWITLFIGIGFVIGLYFAVGYDWKRLVQRRKDDGTRD